MIKRNLIVAITSMFLSSILISSVVFAGSFDFSISLNPSSGTVYQGDTITFQVNVYLVSGTAKQVPIVTYSCPPGATCTFSPSSVKPFSSSTPNVSTATIATTGSTPQGSYTVTVTGGGGAIPPRSADYLLSVAPPGKGMCCLAYSTYYCAATADICPVGGKVDCGTYCSKCSCCGLDTGCPTCGTGNCAGNKMCGSYACNSTCNSWNKVFCCNSTHSGWCSGVSDPVPVCDRCSYAGYESCSAKTRYYNGQCTGSGTCSYSTQGVGCCNDNDCTGYDPVTHTKMVCDCPSADCSYPDPPTGKDDYTCKPKPSCANTKIDCDDKYCCDYEVGGSGNCVKQGTIYGSTQLCDPPEWKTTEGSKNIQSNDLVSKILNFFSNLFSRAR